MPAKKQVWDPHAPVPEGQELEFENAAYEMLHRANCEWPCLSIDFMLPERQDSQFYKSWFPNFVSQANPDDMVPGK